MKSIEKLDGFCFDCSLCKPLEKLEVAGLDEKDDVIERTFTNRKGYWKLNNHRIVKIKFKKDGFVEKLISANSFHSVIRLLENKLIC